jgi:hypothetical protein
MNINLSKDEISLLLSSIGLSLNILHDATARERLEALQTKLMALTEQKE